MSTKKTAPRYQVTADGVWTGGSFATEAEAERAARTVRQQRQGQDVKVEPKGNFITEPESAPAAPAPEPSSPAADPPPPPMPPEDPPPPSKPTKSKK